MFDPHLILRYLTQNQLLNPKQRNGKHNDCIEIDVDSGPDAAYEPRRTPSTGDLVLLWTVSGLTNKPGM